MPFIHNFRMAAPAIVSKTLVLFLILHAILMSLATSQPNFVKHYCFDQNGNYTANSTFQANLNALLYPTSLPTLKSTMASTISQMAKTLTKSTLLGCVEEILSQKLAVVASTIQESFSHNFSKPEGGNWVAVLIVSMRTTGANISLKSTRTVVNIL
ncbi:hypothetical protein D0Y65_054047 [Glycine soja]|uniref:Pectinesterase inhibitor domain-containing protein n=1 Tax=Glycine soja TaxID=3848 RepID=A0A445F4S4_GLYSO|nr:hypothetical protein D0Y65_054047 [Glycine soja]